MAHHPRGAIGTKAHIAVDFPARLPDRVSANTRDSSLTPGNPTIASNIAIMDSDWPIFTAWGPELRKWTKLEITRSALGTRSSELESGIGCGGAIEPRDQIGSFTMRTVDTPYSGTDFSKDITNVNASQYFAGGGWIEGAHSDFWHTETLHLIASVIDQVKS